MKNSGHIWHFYGYIKIYWAKLFLQEKLTAKNKFWGQMLSSIKRMGLYLECNAGIHTTRSQWSSNGIGFRLVAFLGTSTHYDTISVSIIAYSSRKKYPVA